MNLISMIVMNVVTECHDVMNSVMMTEQDWTFSPICVLCQECLFLILPFMELVFNIMLCPLHIVSRCLLSFHQEFEGNKPKYFNFNYTEFEGITPQDIDLS